MPFDWGQCQIPHPSPGPKGWGFQLTGALYRQKYLADDHRCGFGSFIMQTEMMIGEIFVALLYRQNYLAAGHRRDFRSVYKKN